MAKEDIDKKRVLISVVPPPNSALKQVDDVYIVITQAFCPFEHSLITEENDVFDGYPGIKVHVRTEQQSGDVVLSPFHGDISKKGKTDWAQGTKLDVCCPICHESFPKLASCRCPGGGDLIKLYLTRNLSDSHVLAMCNVWGCQRSRTINNWQIISEYLDGEIDD
ncbi:MAG: hypothetical protein GY847_31020 [Proteobacteria bacterium]|nr:hypothetical protein [Pseudomonadota bacterium]